MSEGHRPEQDFKCEIKEDPEYKIQFEVQISVKV